MDASLIIIFGLWIYPIAGVLLFYLTKNNPKIQKRIVYIVFLFSGITILGLLTNISTTITTLDWILVSSIYLTISLVLWWTQFQQNKFLKIIGLIALSLVFGIGYLSGTVGALGVGFVVAEFDSDTEVWLGDGYIYKESSLGNAISDYRGKRVEIYKTFSWLPIIEYRSQKKEYYNIVTYCNKLNLDYKPKENKLYLSASMNWGKEKQIQNWADTLILSN